MDKPFLYLYFHGHHPVDMTLSKKALKFHFATNDEAQSFYETVGKKINDEAQSFVETVGKTIAELELKPDVGTASVVVYLDEISK
jgi:hypothetical protein